MSKYLIEIVVVDDQPGRARAKAKRNIMEALRICGDSHHGVNEGTLALADDNLTLVSTQVAEVVE